MDNSNCPGETTPIFQCADEVPEPGDLQLIVAECYTPIVESISPRR